MGGCWKLRLILAFVGAALLGIPAPSLAAKANAGANSGRPKSDSKRAEELAATDDETLHGKTVHLHTVRGEEPTSDILRVDPYLFLWTLVLFLGLLYVLNRFAWQPILQSVQEREQRIADALREAEAARTEAAALLQQQESELGAAHESIRQMLESVRTEAGKETDELVARAKADAARERAEATAAIEQARQEALATLRESSVSLAAQMTEKFIDRPISADSIRSYVGEDRS